MVPQSDNQFLIWRDWARQKISSRHADKWLGFFSLTDSAVSPIPADPLLIGLCYLFPHRWLRLALITIASSLVGAVIGYALGVVFQVEIITFFNNYLGLGQQFEYVAVQYRDNASWAIFIAAFTPIPYKVFTVSAGIAGISLWQLLIISLFGRSLRFGAVAYIAARFGTRGTTLFTRALMMVTVLTVVGFIGFKLLG